MGVERYAYLALALLMGGIVVAAWVAGLNYFRHRPAQLSAKEKLIGFMLAGPFFGAIHSSLSARGYKLTRREKWGLLFVGGVVFIIITGALISGNTRT